MTRQTWTAFVSAFVFVGLAIALVVVPVSFVTWSAGGTRDTLGSSDGEPLIRVGGIQTYPTEGRLDMTIVATTPADARLSLPQALVAYWLPHRDALPRDVIYAPSKSVAEVETEDADQMVSAQDEAVVAALRAADQPVVEMPAVSSVTVGGPAHQRLFPGDLIVSVDDVATTDEGQVVDVIRRHKVGEKVSFVVIRDKSELTATVETAESPTQSASPVVGISVVKGYRYEPTISFDLGREIGGPSAGLVFALAIYDKITPGPLLQGRHLAGTGAISADGDVSSIGGIQEKIAGADKAGADAFLVPAPNCADLAGVETDMTLIKVSSLSDAIAAIRQLNAGSKNLPRC